MSAKNLLKVLGGLGGNTLVGQIAKGVGGPILSGIADRYGLSQDDEDFSETAADRLLADKEANLFVKDMEDKAIRKLEIEAQSSQDARLVFAGQRESMDIGHRQKVDILMLWESMIMSVGGVVLIFGSYVALIWLFMSGDSPDLPDWLYVLIGGGLTRLHDDLITKRQSYKFGTTQSSANKTDVMSNALKREQNEDEIEAKQKPRIVETVSTTRPIHNPAQAEPQPAAPAPAPEMDEIDAAMADTVSTTRPGSNGDNIL